MDEIKVRFPLNGIWQVVTSPANHVPSHYTHKLGMTYAFDFAKCHDVKRSFLERFKTKDIHRCIGWQQPVLSPCDAEVVEVVDGQEDREQLHFFKDLKSSFQALIFNKKRTDYQSVFGNYIILKTEGYFCLLAHLKKESINVSIGDSVNAGDEIAQLGHCGSALLPHLHVQLMDSSDLSIAKGLPICFDLKVEVNKRWKEFEYCVPTRGFKIQFSKVCEKTSHEDEL